MWSPVNWGSRFTGPFFDSRNHSYSNAYKFVRLFGPGFRFIEPKSAYIASCTTTCAVEVTEKVALQPPETSYRRLAESLSQR